MFACILHVIPPYPTQPIPLRSFVFDVEHPDNILLLEAPPQKTTQLCHGYIRKHNQSYIKAGVPNAGY